MEKIVRQALWNAATTVAELEQGATITREELIDALRRPLPDIDPGEATIRHAYRHHVLRGGITNAEKTVTYDEAADLAGKSVEAIRQAAYRGKLIKLTTYWLGRERSGVTLRSLAEWLNWPHQKFEEAARSVSATD